MINFNKPWFIAGGWAIDLFLNRVTRSHDDIEIAVFRHHQLELQAYLTGWEFTKVVPGKVNRIETWDNSEYLYPPIHEIHAVFPNDDKAEIEILLNESTADRWIFRRNQEITYPLAKLGSISEDGTPYLSPEVVLLYKSKNPSLLDEADFYRVFKALDNDSRKWLRQAIKTIHPDHPWLTLL